MANSTTFKISTERGNQLRALAKFHGMTSASLISKLVAEEIANYEIKGVNITVMPQVGMGDDGDLDATVFFLEDGCEERSAVITCEELLVLADGVESVIDSEITHIQMASGWHFTVRKSGLAIVMTCFAPGRPDVGISNVPMPIEMAREAASEFRRAVQEAHEDKAA